MHADMPESLQTELMKMQVPMPLEIRFDPEFPQRCWVDNSRWNRGDGIGPLYTFGLAFQAALLVAATLGAAIARQEGVRILYRFAPMAILSLWFAIMGLLRLLHGSSVDQWVP